ncbi:hypothetical protein [Acidocella sp.]|uniref:hypothetical protein n=1 Tax=Acidocella sp. TaxID=50710 RepID=UPI0026266458|nr:hypothetical protein [Acidocella sp.]
MALKINISADVRGVRMMLDRQRREIVPQATKATVNALAFEVMQAERAATAEVFKNPRPFTRKAFVVDQATSTSAPEATVYARPEAARYLEPYETGGEHFAPGKMVAEPVDIKLDQYGQLPNGTLERLKQRPDIYVGTINGVSGVWQRVNVNRAGEAKRGRPKRGTAWHHDAGQVRLLIRFAQPQQVNEHFGFMTRASAVIGARFGNIFQRMLRKAQK